MTINAAACELLSFPPFRSFSSPKKTSKNTLWTLFKIKLCLLTIKHVNPHLSKLIAQCSIFHSYPYVLLTQIFWSDHPSRSQLNNWQCDARMTWLFEVADRKWYRPNMTYQIPPFPNNHNNQQPSKLFISPIGNLFKMQANYDNLAAT